MSPNRIRYISRAEAWRIIRSTNGKYFTVAFRRRNDSKTDPFARAGDLRVMNAQLKVTKHLKGGELAYNPREHNLIGCYDVKNAKDYRMINMETLEWVRAFGKHYIVRG